MVACDWDRFLDLWVPSDGQSGVESLHRNFKTLKISMFFFIFDVWPRNGIFDSLDWPCRSVIWGLVWGMSINFAPIISILFWSSTISGENWLDYSDVELFKYNWNWTLDCTRKIAVFKVLGLFLNDGDAFKKSISVFWGSLLDSNSWLQYSLFRINCNFNNTFNLFLSTFN